MEVDDQEVAVAVEAEPTVISESSAVEEVADQDMAEDSEGLQLLPTGVDSVAHLLLLPMVVELQLMVAAAVVDMADPMEIHQPVDPVNLGGRLAYSVTPFPFD